MERHYYVYIMASRSRNLYTGVTGNLTKRVFEHKEGLVLGFTKRYRICRLVYYDAFRDVGVAIEREKKIKSWTRAKRIALIESMNPTWADLAEDWYPTLKKEVQIPRFVRDDKQETPRRAEQQIPRPPRRARDDKHGESGAKGKQTG